MLPFDACLIATGAAAPNWPRAAGLATDAAGFIRVDRTLRSVSHPQVFAAGDMAAHVDAPPKSGVFGVRAGAALAGNILASCNGTALTEWRPQRRALYLISTADGRAIGSWGTLSACGRWVGGLEGLDRPPLRAALPGLTQDGAHQGAAASAARTASTRLRFTPMSPLPTRDAERTWITRAVGSYQNSTSSTNFISRVVYCAYR